MTGEHQFCPELSEEGKEEAKQILDWFKERLKKVADEAISELYCDTLMYIESDSWTNFRNQIMDGFRNYNNRKIHAKYDFKQIRAEMFREYRDEIMAEMSEELKAENERLREELRGWQERRW